VEENEESVEEIVEVVETIESGEDTAQEYKSIDDLRNIDTDAVAESAENVEGIMEEVAEELVYTPDFTYKVKDEVLEFDEGLRAAVTSKESEDLLRDLYTKSMGLDGYKAKYSEAETELNEIKPQLNDMIDGYRNIKELRDSKDYHRLIKTLNWDQEELIDFAERLLEEQELPESQREETKANRDLQDQVQLLNHKVQSFESQTSQRSLAEETNELSSILANEAYSEGVQKLSEVGLDFKNDVIEIGTKMFNESGRTVYPTVGDVVARAYELRQPLLDRLMTKTEVQTNNEQEAVKTEKVVLRQPTLPKVTGTNNNAIEESFTLDKLRTLADQIPT